MPNTLIYCVLSYIFLFQVTLGCTGVVFLRSPRQIQSLAHLTSQLSECSRKTIVEIYKKAVADCPFGHLYISLDNRRPDFLRFQSNLLPPLKNRKIYVLQ